MDSDPNSRQMLQRYELARTVGLRDPTRSVNSIYGMKYQIRNERRSNFAWRKSFKIIFSLATLRDVSKFSTYYSIFSTLISACLTF